MTISNGNERGCFRIGKFNCDNCYLEATIFDRRKEATDWLRSQLPTLFWNRTTMQKQIQSWLVSNNDLATLRVFRHSLAAKEQRAISQSSYSTPVGVLSKQLDHARQHQYKANIIDSMPHVFFNPSMSHCRCANCISCVRKGRSSKDILGLD